MLFAAATGISGPSTVQSYTVCLNPKGDLSDVAVGDVPLNPCKARKTEVHLSGGGITAVQTPAGGGLQAVTVMGVASLSLATIPAARARTFVPVEIPNATLTVLPLEGEEFDTAALHNTVVQNSRLVAPVAGIYTVSAHVSWPLGTAGSRGLFVSAFIGSAFQRVASSVVKASDVGQTEQSVATIVRLSVGDSVLMEVEQSSGAPEIVQVSDHGPTLAMAWLGPG